MFNVIKFEHDGLSVEAYRSALIAVRSDKLPSCRFWYAEGLTSSELIKLIDAKFGEESDEAADACSAPLVITYDDGNVEYVMDAHTSTAQGAYIGYMLGRYAAAHAVPHARVMLLLVQMHHQIEQEWHDPASR